KRLTDCFFGKIIHEESDIRNERERIFSSACIWMRSGIHWMFGKRRQQKSEPTGIVRRALAYSV
ncbi:MAG: hypothetical protein J6B53_01710, partial [Clostridia bacterium]|nr:hypothetical protein [Clostridia bacterium]